YQQVATGNPKNRIGGEMIDQRIGIDENVRAQREVREDHGLSSRPNSGSSATRRSVSASPVQPIRPYDRRTIRSASSGGLAAGSFTDSTVTRTFSCSLSGSGCSGLSRPFS